MFEDACGGGDANGGVAQTEAHVLRPATAAVGVKGGALDDELEVDTNDDDDEGEEAGLAIDGKSNG